MDQFILANIMMFILTFLIVFIIYSINFSRKKIKNKSKIVMEASYLTKRFNLDIKKIKYKNLLFNISLINSFIIAFAFTVVMHIESYVLGLLIGFIILSLITFSLYELLGRHYQKKGEKKNV